MKKFKISYNTIEDDLAHITIDAYSEKDAELIALDSYHDIVEIIQIVEI